MLAKPTHAPAHRLALRRRVHACLPFATSDASSGRLDEPSRGRNIVHAYPLTGRPDADVLPEGWGAIPGPCGCTPEACSFRDRRKKLLAAGARAVFGLSVQQT